MVILEEMRLPIFPSSQYCTNKKSTYIMKHLAAAFDQLTNVMCIQRKSQQNDTYHTEKWYHAENTAASDKSIAQHHCKSKSVIITQIFLHLIGWLDTI